MILFPKCCGPIPGDEIIGYISRGRGIIVHMEHCPMLEKLEQERLLPCYWDHKNPISHHVRIKIVSANKRGLLADISNVFSKSGADIQEAVCKTNEDNATNYFILKIKDKRQLSEMIHKVENLNGVMNVERVSLD